MDLRHEFIRCVERWGDRETIFEGDRTLILNDLAASVATVCGAVRSADQTPASSVGLLLPNSQAFLSAFYGTIFAGKIPALLNPAAPPAELASTIRRTGIHTILAISPLRRSVAGLAAEEGLATLKTLYLDEMAGGSDQAAKAPSPHRPPLERLAEMAQESIPEVACILFSSGTTGQPKGVLLTHDNLISNHEAVCQTFDFGPKDTILQVLPFYHSFGLCVLHLGLWPGLRLVLAPRFVPTECLLAITKHNVSILLLVPQLYHVLARTDGVKDVDWSRVRLCLAGGAAAPKALREEWQAVAGQPLYQGYGLTEHSPVVSLCVPRCSRDGSVGKPIPGVEVKIVDDTGREAGPAGQGEICVRGRAVMKGYHANPQATAGMIDAAGWLHTGDHGFLDDDGFLFISGRQKDIIIVAGENVHPSEIEETLLAHPAVLEAAVIGVPDALRGETPKAFVVLRPERQTDAHALRVYLRERLAPYKIPREVALVEQLPKNALGKVVKGRLSA